MRELKWRREFYEPMRMGDTLPAFDPERIVGAVEGTAKEVINADPPSGSLARLRLLNPPDIRVGDYVRHDDPEGGEPFVAVVTRVGKAYDSGVFNVDVRRPDTGDTGTVPCEYCEVVFRPHSSLWTGREIEPLALGPDGVVRSFTLLGAAPGRLARLVPVGKNLWTVWHVAFMEGDTCRDSMEAKDVREAAALANAWLYGREVKVGDSFWMTINQGSRFCQVVAVKKTRYRIEYDMPNAGAMGSWQTGVRIAGTLLMPIDWWHHR